MTGQETLKAITAETAVRKLLIQGYSEPEIANTLSLSRKRVSRIVYDIFQDFRRRAGLEFDAQVAEQLGRIEQIEQAAWEAWERSQCQFSRERTKTDRDGEITLQRRVKRDYNAGNPQFLRILIDCVKERATLLGLKKGDDPLDDPNVDDIPIVAVVIEDREQKNKVQEAETFLAKNTVEGLVLAGDASDSGKPKKRRAGKSKNPKTDEAPG